MKQKPTAYTNKLETSSSKTNLSDKLYSNLSTDETILRPIAYIHSDFTEKFGIPRQSGLVDTLQAKLIFTEEFRNEDCCRGIEEFSHLWLIWGFSKNPKGKWTPTIRPPRLGGNKRKGVFASRSPFRPNSLGLSSVRLEKYVSSSPEGPVLYISGADLLDKTPVYDIKPYLPFTDSHPQAAGSFSTKALEHQLSVHCKEDLLCLIPKEKRQSLLDCLSLDPRPSYQHDPARIYGMEYAGFNIHFKVIDNDLFVTDITVSCEIPKAY